jgi:hypothetical protein
MRIANNSRRSSYDEKWFALGGNSNNAGTVFETVCVSARNAIYVYGEGEPRKSANTIGLRRTPVIRYGLD